MPGLVKLRVSVIWNCFVPHCHSPHTATGGGASVTPCLSVCSGGVILSGERGGLRGGRQARPGPLGRVGAPWALREAPGRPGRASGAVGAAGRRVERKGAVLSRLQASAVAAGELFVALQARVAHESLKDLLDV